MSAATMERPKHRAFLRDDQFDPIIMRVERPEVWTGDVQVWVTFPGSIREHHVQVDDSEPEDVWGPILHRAFEEAYYWEFGSNEHPWMVDGWVMGDSDGDGEWQVWICEREG